MFNMSRIMKTAWHDYRFQTGFAGKPKSAALWSEMLKGAWRQERDRLALEAVRERRAAMDPASPAYRIESIEAELVSLQYQDKPIAKREAALKAELKALQSEIAEAA